MKRFNVRVYGIIINERDEILVSHESHSGRNFTKFPGGGLEFGEGTKNCLKREFQEEFNLSIEVGELFYINDFFQQSAFSENDQVLSIYYTISASTEELDLLMTQNGNEEQLQWIKRTDFSEEHVTFPIDKVVSSLLKNS